MVLSLYLGLTLAIFVALLPVLVWMAIALPVMPAIVMAFMYRIADRLVDLFSEEKSPNQSFWPTLADWRQGIRAMIVLIVTTAFSVASTLSLVIVTGGGAVVYGFLALWTEQQAFNAGYELGRFLSEHEILVKHLAVVWMTCSTCLYRYDDWARLRKQRRKEFMAKAAQPKTQKFIPPDRTNVGQGKSGVKSKAKTQKFIPDRTNVGAGPTKGKSRVKSKTRKAKKRSPSSSKSQKRKSDRK